MSEKEVGGSQDGNGADLPDYVSDGEDSDDSLVRETLRDNPSLLAGAEGEEEEEDGGDGATIVD